MTANDFDFKCAEEMLGALFALEDALGLMPTEGGGLGVDSRNKFASKISMALKTWSDMRSKLEKQRSRKRNTTFARWIQGLVTTFIVGDRAKSVFSALGILASQPSKAVRM